MTEYEYEYYSGSKMWPNMNIIRAQKCDRIWILFGAPLLIKYEYEYLDYLNNTEYE